MTLTSVNNTSGLWSLGAFTDRPLTNLVSTSGEEAAQIECLTHGHNDLGKRRLGAQLLALFLSLRLGLELRRRQVAARRHAGYW